MPRHARPRETRDFEDEETRIDPSADGILEVSEIMEVIEVGDHRQVHSGRTTLKRPERGDEKSVIRRFVENVVTAVPRAIKKAVDKTGAHKIKKPVKRDLPAAEAQPAK